MTMKFLQATSDATGYHYSIWLDTTKTESDGKTPDPTYVRNYDWSPAPTDWTGGAAAYQQMTLDEVKLLAQADLTALEQAQNPTPTPTDLSVNGQTF